MAQIPGAAARHAIITDECRANRGNDGAADEAVNRIRTTLGELLKSWPSDVGVKFHLVVTVERPQRTDLTNEQAEAAYDAAPADPISDEEAKSLVRIATAKGVTEALRDLIDVYDNGTVIDLENEFEKARAAIAKATGGE